MTSDALQQLRNLHKQQAKIYQEHTSAREKIKATYHPNSPEYRDGMQAAHDTARRALFEVEQRMTSAAQQIQKRGLAVGQSISVSPETRQRVQRMIDKKWDWQSISSQLASEGDRAGLRALREELLIEMKPQASKSAQRLLSEAWQHLDEQERPLYTEQERRLIDENRELNINLPFMKSNMQALHNHVDYSERSPSSEPRVESMLRWSGLPSDQQPKGLFDPAHAEGQEAGE